MSSTRLINDTARDLAKAVVYVFSNLLRDEEKVDAFHEVYELARSHLDHFVRSHRRELRRLAALPPEQPRPDEQPSVPKENP